MTYSKPARPTTRRIPRILVVGPLIVIAAITVALGDHLRPAWPSTAASPIDARPNAHPGALGQAGGAVPSGTTVFDDEIPGVANLDPALLAALRQAARDAAHDGVQLFVTSGWRSPEYQEQLLQEAVAKYGSEKQAARWVATPRTSAHVSGSAVDIGPLEATTWLSKHGPKYGLCQIYTNEPWHYELRRAASDRRVLQRAPALPPGGRVPRPQDPPRSGQGCPPMYPDPTSDPRLQQ